MLINSSNRQMNNEITNLVNEQLEKLSSLTEQIAFVKPVYEHFKKITKTLEMELKVSKEVKDYIKGVKALECDDEVIEQLISLINKMKTKYKENKKYVNDSGYKCESYEKIVSFDGYEFTIVYDYQEYSHNNLEIMSKSSIDLVSCDLISYGHIEYSSKIKKDIEILGLKDVDVMDFICFLLIISNQDQHLLTIDECKCQNDPSPRHINNTNESVTYNEKHLYNNKTTSLNIF